MALQRCFAIILLLALFSFAETQTAESQSVSAYDLISLINGMRSANGLGSLSTDSSLMACAQSTAETMAASHMQWHIGNVSGRASSFGYNNYNTCFATENFMVGTASTTISQIQAAWSDASHMIPAQSSSYCHIGAGVAASGDGMYYFVVQAAYPAGVAGCGYARSTGNSGTSSDGGSAGSVPVGIIKSVITATPDESGMIYHKVDEGQTLWSISEAYHVSIQDLQGWNNLANSTALSVGQLLYIPSANQTGSTPTPQAELTVFPTQDSQGRYYHTVSEGDTLWSISELWKVPLNSIYQFNNLTADDSIGLGWTILIPVTPTVTPVPTETPSPSATPTDTPVPSASISIGPESEIPSVSATERIATPALLHTPGASSRTYIILGLGCLILIGAGFLAYGMLRRKK